ncbi:MAG TPA: hypothetical protein VF169_08260 [Albitalea sp.]|uniref:hypothetical protein n=1 Tax=Piscinibacter sp. TaxID=1903157 RepID=UPI002ED474ED
MRHFAPILLVLSCALLAACGKKHEPAPTAAAPAPAPAPTQAQVAAEMTDEQRQLARKQALMDYATMEDKYLNDPRGQWAAEAKASSTFGEGPGKSPSTINAAANVTGPVDSKQWTNAQQDIGFDWLETSYAKPVSATEIRVVFRDGKGVEAVSKLEVQDTGGKWTTVWTGLSDVKYDKRGSRTWFVKTFDKTPLPVKAVKVTIANNVQSGYKEVDAVQLVGD